MRFVGRCGVGIATDVSRETLHFFCETYPPHTPLILDNIIWWGIPRRHNMRERYPRSYPVNETL